MDKVFTRFLRPLNAIVLEMVTRMMIDKCGEEYYDDVEGGDMDGGEKQSESEDGDQKETGKKHQG